MCRQWAGDGMTGARQIAEAVWVDRGLVGRMVHADGDTLITSLGVAGAMRGKVEGLVDENGLVSGIVYADRGENLSTGKEILAHGGIRVVSGSLIVIVSWVTKIGFKVRKEGLSYGRNCVTGDSLFIVAS